MLIPWSLAVAVGVKPVILPPITKVTRSGVALMRSDVLGPAVLASLGRVSLGFLLAALTAVPLGRLGADVIAALPAEAGAESRPLSWR